MRDIYPCTIVTDRYTGAYSGGKYTAWNLNHWEVPQIIEESDVPCSYFWDEERRMPRYVIGLGDTPQQAYDDLGEKLDAARRNYREVMSAMNAYAECGCGEEKTEENGE